MDQVPKWAKDRWARGLICQIHSRTPPGKHKEMAEVSAMPEARRKKTPIALIPNPGSLLEVIEITCWVLPNGRASSFGRDGLSLPAMLPRFMRPPFSGGTFWRAAAVQ